VQRHAFGSGDLLTLDPAAGLPLALEVEHGRRDVPGLARRENNVFREVEILLFEIEARLVEPLVRLAPVLIGAPSDPGRLAGIDDDAVLALVGGQEQFLPPLPLHVHTDRAVPHAAALKRVARRSK